MLKCFVKKIIASYSRSSWLDVETPKLQDTPNHLGDKVTESGVIKQTILYPLGEEAGGQ